MAQTPKNKVRISLHKKLLFSLVVFFAFFGLLEGVLVLAGLGGTSATADPFVGFSSQHPLFVADGDQPNTHLQTAANKLVWFNDQRFARNKEIGTRRIFCVGGSTTFGRPYSDATSFCGWLREFLPVVDDDWKWEVINAGGVSYASFRVAAVMSELAEYQPDLFIVYTGQNEFLERRTYQGLFEQSPLQRNLTALLAKTRTFNVLKQVLKPEGKIANDSSSGIRLSGEVDELLNHTVGPSDYHRDPEWQANVLQDYAANLQQMKRIAKEAGAEILFVVPASNEKDCSPFKSELNQAIDDSEQDEFARLIGFQDPTSLAGEMLDAVDAENDDVRLAQLRTARQIDDSYADVHYRIGQFMFASGSIAEATEAFNAALENDICPLRASQAIQSTVRDLVVDSEVMIVDFDEKLRDRCEADFGHRILGAEYFLDHVHPTIDVHQDLALWILERLREQNWVGGNPPGPVDVERIDQAVRSRIDSVAQGVALRNLAKVLHWSGKFAEAIPRARDALERLSNDPESLLVLADCLRQTGELEDAVVTCEFLVDVAPTYALAYLLYGELLMDLQQYEAAVDVCTFAAMALPPESDRQLRAEFLLGVAYLNQEEFQQADSLLRRVQEFYPDNLDTMMYLAQAKVGIGQPSFAIKIYEHVIEHSIDRADPHYRLGVLLLEENRYAEALTRFESVLELDADYPNAAVQRDIARQLASRGSDAAVNRENNAQ